MRVTIGDRLGIRTHLPPRHVVRTPPRQDDEVQYEPPVVQVLRLADVPSSRIVPAEVVRPEPEGPPRKRGEMIWIKKDVAILRIEGSPPITPDEYASNRRR